MKKVVQLTMGLGATFIFGICTTWADPMKQECMGDLLTVSDETPFNRADLNRDGKVDITDLLIFSGSWQFERPTPTPTTVPSPVVWSEDFSVYADTSSLKEAYVQAHNAGARYAITSTNDILLATDPEGISGNVLQFHVDPKLEIKPSNYYLFWWVYVGTSNPFPTGVFQNGTDFNVRYDIRTTSFIGGFGGLSHKVGGAATCMPLWSLTDPNAVFIANRGASSLSVAGHSWAQLFAGFRGLDARLNNANINANNGNVGGVAFDPELQAINTWYTCRLAIQWPINGVTTNTTATCMFKVWLRGTSEPVEPTCTYSSWPGDTAIQKGTSGAATGDGYGVYGAFQDPGATGVAYDQYVDNVVFENTLVSALLNN